MRIDWKRIGHQSPLSLTAIQRRWHDFHGGMVTAGKPSNKLARERPEQ